MFKIILSFFIVASLFSFASAQQVLPKSKMTFVATVKPNTIVFNDSIYNGSRAFKHLFYKTNNQQLITLYKVHQFNKILGNSISTIGALALPIGVVYASNDHPNISRTAGWVITGTGFLSTIIGGYLITRGNANLILATKIFNDRYTNRKDFNQIEIGLTNNGLGLALKW